ncbi:uncharacterized protein [Linepithema humile]|uniref:uncharacterized protein n=1 Tax=Linepithema humile TaxID=83485 RepID=UPI00351DE1EF
MQTGKKIKGVGSTPFKREVLKNQLLLKTAIYEIMDIVRNLSDEVKKLQQSSKNGKAKDFVMEKTNLPQFPMTTIENLEALEGLLIEKPEACVELAQLFELRKHKDAPSTIRRGLMLIFYPLLACSVS